MGWKALLLWQHMLSLALHQPGQYSEKRGRRKIYSDLAINRNLVGKSSWPPWENNFSESGQAEFYSREATSQAAMLAWIFGDCNSRKRSTQITGKAAVSALPDRTVLLHYNLNHWLYQMLSFYIQVMPKRYLMCSMNFVAAKLNGCCFFHASTLLAVSSGDNGR